MVKIILAVDGSEPSLSAAHAVIKHRAMFSAPVEIYIVHVAAPIPKLYGLHVVVDSATLERIIKEDAKQATLGSEMLFEKWAVACKVHNFVGEVAHMINDFAESQDADFIYVGTHGRGSMLSTISSALRGALLGSTTLKLLHTAKIPVVVIHSSESTVDA